MMSAMGTVTPAYFEIIDFIAAGTTPEGIIAYRPSHEERVSALIEREKLGSLSTDDKAELEHFMQL